LMEKIGNAYRFLDESGDYVYIGDPQASKFEPLLMIERWKGECFIKSKFDASKITQTNVRLDESDNKVKFETPALDIHFYQISGGVEFEFILKQKPLKNILELSIEIQDLKFYYQPPLHPDHPTWIDMNGDGVADSFRPENVVGSYAVYRVTRTNMYNEADAEKYKAGKAFHIYRPKLTDAKGKTAWAELNINELEKTLTIKLPQAFLDSAIYPVELDPTFGKTDIGASYTGAGGSAKFASRAQLTENGNVTKITWYGRQFSGTSNVKAAIYDDTSVQPDALENGATQEINVGETPAWHDNNYSTPVSLSAAYYWLSVFWDANVQIWYDSGGDSVYKWVTYVDEPSDPFGTHYDFDAIFSIYATYTTGAVLKEVTDSLSLSDVVLRNKSLSISDQIALTDTPSTNKTFSISDVISLLEQALTDKTFPITDVISLVDQVLRDKSFTVTDAISLTELVTVITEIIKEVLDSIGLSDAVAVNKTLLIVTDSLSLSDTLLINKILQVSDSIGLSEVITKIVPTVAKTKIFLIIGDLAIQLTG